MPSIFDLNINELEEILKSNTLPEGVTLQGIEDRKDFDRLFRSRNTPKHIATTLIREKQSTIPKEPKQRGGNQDSEEIKQRRLELKALELDIKGKSKDSLTQLQQNIYKRLQAVEDGQVMIIHSLANLNQKVSELLGNIANRE